MKSKELKGKILRGILGGSICFISLIFTISCEKPKEKPVKEQVIEKLTTEVKKEEPPETPLAAPPRPRKWTAEDDKLRTPAQEALLKDLQASDYCVIAAKPTELIKGEYKEHPKEQEEFENFKKKFNEDSSYYRLIVRYKASWMELCDQGNLNLPELWGMAQEIKHSVKNRLYWSRSQGIFESIALIAPGLTIEVKSDSSKILEPYLDFHFEHNVFDLLARISTNKIDHDFFRLIKMTEKGDPKVKAFSVCSSISKKNIEVIRGYEKLLEQGVNEAYYEEIQANIVRIKYFYFEYINRISICYCPDLYPDPLNQLLALREYYFKRPSHWLENSSERFSLLMHQDVTKFRLKPVKENADPASDTYCALNYIPTLYTEDPEPEGPH